MPTLPRNTIAALLEPYLPHVSDLLVEQLSSYLDLLVKWNARTNLTAIREPEEIVRRHFGESLFAGAHLPEAKTLLDFGSGAGFPGVPIQLLRPHLLITLGESQNKKASFLREVVRILELKTEVWANRIEAMPVERSFDVVIMRAVDKMPVAIAAATLRANTHLIMLSTKNQFTEIPAEFGLRETLLMPGTQDQVLLIASRA